MAMMSVETPKGDRHYTTHLFKRMDVRMSGNDHLGVFFQSTFNCATNTNTSYAILKAFLEQNVLNLLFFVKKYFFLSQFLPHMKTPQSDVR